MVGTRYEKIASDYLESKGYKIITKNFRTPYAEIDIVALHQNILIFCEVKYRKNEKCGNPLEAVDSYKQFRISQAAMYYYSRNAYDYDTPCRFDVIAVTGSKITHIKNAFEFRER